MSKLDSLRDLSSSKISLTSNSKRKGQAYTDQEKELACHIAVCGARLVDVIPEDHPMIPLVPEELIEDFISTMEEQGETCVASICRAVYRAHEKSKVEAGTEGFPKRRDPTSVQIVFRGVLKRLGIPQNTIDMMFPRYGSKPKGEQAS